MCPYFPHCEAQHGALQCVRLALMTKEHREAMDIARKVCLQCREVGVEADGGLRPVRESPHTGVRTEAVGGAMAETKLDCGSRGRNRPGLL